jgi:gliding motility-associated-like protein
MKRSLLLLLFILMICQGYAQVCNGAFGDIAGGTNFGKGTVTYGNPLNAANTGKSFYVARTPDVDGFYTIVKTTLGMSLVTQGNWHQVANHTPNDPDGYMMLINASEEPGIFYQEVIDDLCPNTTYEFSAYVVNVLRIAGSNPSLTFTIENAITHEELKKFDTPEIQRHATPVWEQQSTVFRTPGDVTSVIIKIRNNAPGGNGNDLALDDITFRACGPLITPSIDSSPISTAILCAGESRNFTISAAVAPGVYIVPEYQWQILRNDIWENLNGETTTSFLARFTHAQEGITQYRMLAAEHGSINSTNCRTASAPITITAVGAPHPSVGPNPICTGGTIYFDVLETIGTYEWRNPAGEVFSRIKSPVISNATEAMTGAYSVSVLNGATCLNTAHFGVTVLPELNAGVADSAISTCKENGSVQLKAYGGTTYHWTPATGLSATDIADPFANPTESTTYTVTVGNGTCERSFQVKIRIFENIIANAGEDKTILAGQSTVLNGSTNGNGDHATYIWTPWEGLDDPSKLNPVATPKKDVTYILHAFSNLGCVDSHDEVFVKVIPTLVISNTFSPNGDGINDYWTINGLEADPNVKVRDGQEVYFSKGYKSPWNGKYRGQDLPVGTYYYLITLKSEVKKRTGWLMIVR